MLAITASNFKRLPSRLRPFLLWVGLIAIGLGAFITSDVGEFPFWQIAIAVVGAAMVIIAGTGETPRYSTILTNRLSVYLGDVSYSLYLWHWPVIVFLGLLMPGNVFFRTAAVLLMFGLTIAAYEFFENPIRHSNWLGQKGVSKRSDANSHTRRRRRRRTQQGKKALRRAGAVSLTMVTAGVVMVVLTPATPRLSTTPSVNYQQGPNEVAEQPERVKLSEEISDALRAEEWPVLSPSLDDVVSGRADSYIKGCMDDVRKSITDCTRGALGAPHTIVLVGDSSSMSYTGAFESIVDASNGQWRMELRNFLGCSFMAGHFQFPGRDDAKEKACPGNVESTISAIEAERPDIVVVSNGDWDHKLVSNGRAQTLDEREESIRNVVLRISKSSGKVILLPSPPNSTDLRECYTRISSPRDCVGSIPQWWFDKEQVDRGVAAGIDNASFISSTWTWFCSGDGRCPPFVGTLPVRYDFLHLTAAFSRRLGPVVQEAFSAVGVTF
jgi:hypothetical protein